MLKNKIHKNLLKEAMKLKDDILMNFIIQRYNIHLEDILIFMIEEGLTYRFNEFLEIHNNCILFLSKFVNKDILNIIKSYLNIYYSYIGKKIIDDFDIFKKFMKYLYIGQDTITTFQNTIGFHPSCIDNYRPVYYYSTGWNMNIHQSIILYCLWNNSYQQLKYLLDNNYINDKHIKELKARNDICNLTKIFGKNNKCYNLIKHLL